MDNKELVLSALKAAENSYAPYSQFNVGAALLTKRGKVYLGCNVENASFSPTCCAERTAFFKAVSEGEREFIKIAVVGGKDGSFDEFCPPCGVCRQVMREFCDDNFTVVLGKKDGSYKELRLFELLPFGFSLKDGK